MVLRSFSAHSREDILALCGDLIDKYDFRYDIVDGKELEKTILMVMKAVDSGNFKPSGKERKKDWEKGWQENLDRFVESGFDLNELVPRYVRLEQAVRLNGDYVMPLDPWFELNFYTVFRHGLFRT